MSHKSIEELKKSLEEAKRLVMPGSYYFHYKHPETHYLIVDIVIEEATDAPMVLYRNTDGITFARPLRSFIESVDSDGREVKRFTFVN